MILPSSNFFTSSLISDNGVEIEFMNPSIIDDSILLNLVNPFSKILPMNANLAIVEKGIAPNTLQSSKRSFAILKDSL